MQFRQVSCLEGLYSVTIDWQYPFNPCVALGPPFVGKCLFNAHLAQAFIFTLLCSPMVKADVASYALSTRELVLMWNGLPPFKTHGLAHAKDGMAPGVSTDLAT